MKKEIIQVVIITFIAFMLYQALPSEAQVKTKAVSATADTSVTVKTLAEKSKIGKELTDVENQAISSVTTLTQILTNLNKLKLKMIARPERFGKRDVKEVVTVKDSIITSLKGLITKFK